MCIHRLNSSTLWWIYSRGRGRGWFVLYRAGIFLHFHCAECHMTNICLADRDVIHWNFTKVRKGGGKERVFLELACLSVHLWSGRGGELWIRFSVRGGVDGRGEGLYYITGRVSRSAERYRGLLLMLQRDSPLFCRECRGWMYLRERLFCRSMLVLALSFYNLYRRALSPLGISSSVSDRRWSL